MVTIFTYYNPEDGKMDDGYTQHSGCPVIEGEKWITTAWMRKGVTRTRDWTIYDPSGVEILNYDSEGNPISSPSVDEVEGEVYTEENLDPEL